MADSPLLSAQARAGHNEFPLFFWLSNILEFTWAIFALLNPGPHANQLPDQPCCPLEEDVSIWRCAGRDGDAVWSTRRLPVIVLDSPFVFHAWIPTHIRVHVWSARSPYQWQQSWVINKLRIFFALICLEASFFFWPLQKHVWQWQHLCLHL